LLFFTIFFDLEEIIFENFNISENNIICVELAKVQGYFLKIMIIIIKHTHTHYIYGGHL